MKLEITVFGITFSAVTLVVFGLVIVGVLGYTTIGKTLVTNTDLSSGLVGHWTFDGKDMSGITVIDTGSGGNNGSYAGLAFSAIDSSLRFNDDDTAYLSRTPSGASNKDTWTWSGWVKRGNLSSIMTLFGAGVASTRVTKIRFLADDTLDFQDYNGSDQARLITTAVFRDPSTWHHIVFVYDSTNGTANDRMRFWVDGEEITSFGTRTNPSQDQDVQSVNSTDTHHIGINSYSAGHYFDGYLSDVHFIDGEVAFPGAFGKFDDNGRWVPKAYSGSYGTNGFHLDFASSTETGTDASGNGNNFTENNIDVTDQVIDTPTNFFPTLSSIDLGSGITLSQGNLTDTNAVTTNTAVRGTIWPSSGKWYWEVVPDAATMIGVCDQSHSLGTYPGNSARSWAIRTDSGNKLNNGSSVAYGNSSGPTDLVLVAVDLDNGKIWWGENGTWFGSGDPAAGTNAAFTTLSGYTLAPCVNHSSRLNFGQSPNPTSTATTLTYDSAAGGYFLYTPPSGFKALSTANLPANAIDDPSNYFDVNTRTGTGASFSVSGFGFQPSLVWAKERGTADGHRIFSTGLTNTYTYLETNSTGAEVNNSNNLTSFNSDGFSGGSGSGTTGFNDNTATYVDWMWKEDPTSGFDIVTYTGTGSAHTESHSLSSAPEMIIVKDRTAASTNDWAVYHAADTTAPETDYLLLNSTAATADDNTYWNDTAPTASVFSVGTNADVNTSSHTYVAYLFDQIDGYSKFGSYTGNASTNGPFVYTGFKPRYIMIKRTDTAAYSWQIQDTERSPENPLDERLLANQTATEDTGSNYYADALVNGFKLRATEGSRNASGGTYIYAAFAELPFAFQNENSPNASQASVPGRIGQGLSFDGVSNYIDIGATGENVKTVSFWMKANSTTESIIDLNGSAYISASAGTLSATGFTSPTIYVDGAVSSTITANEWHHVAITTNTNVSASDMDIGRVTDTYFSGTLDDVRTYGRALSANEITRLYHLGATTVIGKTLNTNSSLEDSLIGHWTFDGKDMVDKVADTSGQGYDGYFRGQTLGVTSTTTAPGVIGQAMQFDGIDDHVFMGDVDAYDGMTNFTLAVWVKTTGTGEQHYIAKEDGIGNDGAFSIFSGYPSAGQAGFAVYFGVGTVKLALSGTNIADGRWHHLVGTYDGSLLHIYVDGVHKDDTSWAGTPYSTGYGLSIGATNEGSNGNMEGELDDARIYNRALSQEEVTRLYHLGATTHINTTLNTNVNLENGLVSHWTFDGKYIDTSSDTALDRSNEGNDATTSTMTLSSSGTPGKFGQALSFDGSSEYMTMLDPPTGTGAFSVASWVYLYAYSANHAGIIRSIAFDSVPLGGDIGSFYLSVLSTGAVCFANWRSTDNNDTDGAESTGGGAIPLGDWHHIAATWNGSTNTVYLDGVATTTSQTATGGGWGSGQDIGRIWTDSNYYLNGKLDDIRVYDRALSATEVERLYELGI